MSYVFHNTWGMRHIAVYREYNEPIESARHIHLQSHSPIVYVRVSELYYTPLYYI